MFGADKDLHHLNQQYVIKCHVCGSQNLRYIGPAARPAGGYVTNSDQSPYICDNGHDTWGAIDQWNVKGQSDEQTARVNDCCCEGFSCHFPEKLFVQFSGIKGVQLIEGNKGKWGFGTLAKDSWDHSWDLDFKTRVFSPFRMCEPCRYGEILYSGPLEDTETVALGWKHYYFGYKGDPDYLAAMDEETGLGPVFYRRSNIPPIKVWPYRIPTFQSTADAPVRNQLYYNNLTGKYYAPDDSISPGQCECYDLGPTIGSELLVEWATNETVGTRIYSLFCGDPAYGYLPDPGGEPGSCNSICHQDYPCFEDKAYPPCMEVGTHKCFSKDARYRIPCSNPNKFFTINFPDTNVYSAPLLIGVNEGAVAFQSNWCHLPSVVPPVIDGNGPQACQDFANAAGRPFVPVAPYAPGCEIMGPQITQIEQPHCARRVKSPSVKKHHAYAVNTDDLSNQLIVLDRYYDTGDVYDYKQEYSSPNSIKWMQLFSSNMNNYPDLGLSDRDKERLLPFPWTAHSGSLEEPELVAIIHSDTGTGGQIAFDTFPVSMDTDILVDPVDGYDSELGYGVYSCGFKHRVTTHGYGVKYPLIDDPIWKEEQGLYEYPVFLKGKGYKVGDKIEFRCWKELVNYNAGGLATPKTPQQLASQNTTEDPYYQISKEIVVATAVVSEVDESGGILWYDFDEYDNQGNLLATVGNSPCRYDICGPGKNPFIEKDFSGQKLWVLDPAQIQPINTGICPGCMSKEVWGDFELHGRYYLHNPVDALPRRWELVRDPNAEPDDEAARYIPMITGLTGFPSYPNPYCVFSSVVTDNPKYPYAIIDVCEYTQQSNKLNFCTGQDEAYTKNFRDPDNLTICNDSCSYKVFCSKPALGASHTPAIDTECKKNCYCEPGFVLSCAEVWKEDINDNSWLCDCVNNPEYGQVMASDSELRLIQAVNSEGGISYEQLFGDQDPLPEIDPGVVDPLPPECFSDQYPISKYTLGETFPGTCRCYSQNPGPNSNIIQAANHLPSDPDNWDISPEKCFPEFNTWNWLSTNYGKVSCSGDPVVRSHRPYYVGNVMYPPRQTQYKLKWLPKPMTILEKLDKWMPMSEGRDPTIQVPDENGNMVEVPNATNEELRRAKVAFLQSSIGCNPLQLDIFKQSYKFPYTDYSEEDIAELDKPCRLQNNYQGVGTLFVSYSGGSCRPEPDLLDDGYCRVYGFYQQKSFNCDVVYKGQYILRSSQIDVDSKEEGIPQYGTRPYGRNCEPVIEDMTIRLKKKEARFEITVGAPMSQDYLFPEQLPYPRLDSQGRYESIAPNWPFKETDDRRIFTRMESLQTHPKHDTYYFHGFYDIERISIETMEYIPPAIKKEKILDANEPLGYRWELRNTYPYEFLDDPPYESVIDSNGNLPTDPDVEQLKIIATTYMQSVDWDDKFEKEIGGPLWDYSDPRSIVRLTKEGMKAGDPSPLLSYNEKVDKYLEDHHFPMIGERTSFVNDCPYPWENNVLSIITTTVVDPNTGEVTVIRNPNPLFYTTDFYCMYENHSAELKLGAIEECNVCLETELLYTDGVLGPFTDIVPEEHKGKSYISYTVLLSDVSEDKDGNIQIDPKKILFRFWGSLPSNDDGISLRLLTEIMAFTDEVSELFKIGEPDDEKYVERFLTILNASTFAEGPPYGRELFSNMFLDQQMFKNSYADAFEITKFEVISVEEFVQNNETVYEGKMIYTESRCKNPLVAGSIEHIIVENGGEGYAFEIEERVAPSGTALLGPEGVITATIEVYSKTRRRETYRIKDEDLAFEGLAYPYEKDQIVPIRFNDADARRGGIVYDTLPSIKVLEVQETDLVSDTTGEITVPAGTILRMELYHPGIFYKYVGIGEHRAYPISIIVNNYWDDRDTIEKVNIGKNALFRPVVGIDPLDPDTYGKIKRIEIDWGGIGYVEPNTYWMIHTELGEKDDWGDLSSGLEIQHLVDQSKYCDIIGDRNKVTRQAENGISGTEVAHIKYWLSMDPGASVDDDQDDDLYNLAFGSYRQSYMIPDKSFPNSRLPLDDMVESPLKNIYDEEGLLIGNLGPDFTKAVRFWYKTYDNNYSKSQWSYQAGPWSDVIQAGTCPVGTGGLLDRTYRMALIEEVDTTNQQGGTRPNQPYPSYCDEAECNYIVNDVPSNSYTRTLETVVTPEGKLFADIVQTFDVPANGIWLTNAGPGLQSYTCQGISDPNDPNVGGWDCWLDTNEMADPMYFASQGGGGRDWDRGLYARGHGPYDLQWLGCSVFTAYDAHRYAMVGDHYHDSKAVMPVPKSIFRIGGFNWNDWSGTASKGRPLINGCPNRFTNMGWEHMCFGSWNINGNEPFGPTGHGWLDFRDQMTQDDCYTGTEYGIYGEVVRHELNNGATRGYRAKMITYKMGGTPITMKITPYYSNPTRNPNPADIPKEGFAYCITNAWVDQPKTNPVVGGVDPQPYTYYTHETVITQETYAEILQRYGITSGDTTTVPCQKGLPSSYECTITITPGECPNEIP